MKKYIECSAAVIVHKGRIFAAQRGYGAQKGGWEFPGGKGEVGESREETLKREIMEELDTVIEIDDFLVTVTFENENVHLTLNCFLCHVVSGELTLKEHMDSRWLDRDSLDSVEWLDADKKVLPHIRKRVFGE